MHRDDNNLLNFFYSMKVLMLFIKFKIAHINVEGGITIKRVEMQIAD